MNGPFSTLVVLGESTVQGGGWLANDNERYADILAHLLETAQEQPLAYINAGIGASVISPASPGYDASAKPSAMERLNEQVISSAPDLLVIAYGLNDMRAGMPITSFRNEMTKLIMQIRSQINPLIVLVNVYYMTAYNNFPPFDIGSKEATLAYNQMLAELAAEQKCLYVDVYSALVDCDHVIHPDTVHANKIGNMLIANRIFETIIRNCPAITHNIRKRDEQTAWTELITPMLNTCREPSDTSRPGE